MNINPVVDINPKSINCSVSPTFDHLTTEEIEDLILNARSPEARLWIAILYDTGIRKEALIDLRLEDLDLDTLRPRIIVTQEAISDDNIISPELGPRTARDLRAYIEARSLEGGQLWPWPRDRTRRMMTRELHEARSGACIDKKVYPYLFRAMRVRRMALEGRKEQVDEIGENKALIERFVEWVVG